MDGVTVTLKKPIEFDGEKVTELTLHELTVDELIEQEERYSGKGLNTQDKYAIAKSARVSHELIGKLKQSDWQRLRAKYFEQVGNEQDDQALPDAT